ncbi:MAG: 50S ribosomal protein L39e [Nitrososphaerota archaeon]
MTIRTLALKKKLSKALKRTWPVPAWVIVKTRRKFRTHSKSRHWRRSGKIKT